MMDMRTRASYFGSSPESARVISCDIVESSSSAVAASLLATTGEKKTVSYMRPPIEATPSGAFGLCTTLADDGEK